MTFSSPAAAALVFSVLVFLGFAAVLFRSYSSVEQRRCRRVGRDGRRSRPAEQREQHVVACVVADGVEPRDASVARRGGRSRRAPFLLRRRAARRALRRAGRRRLRRRACRRASVRKRGREVAGNAARSGRTAARAITCAPDSMAIVCISAIQPSLRVRRRCDPDLGSAAIRPGSARAAFGSPSRSGRRHGRTVSRRREGRSPWARPWNIRSCLVGIACDASVQHAGRPEHEERVVEGVKVPSASRSLTPTTQWIPVRLQASARRSIRGPGIVTLSSHIRA